MHEPTAYYNENDPKKVAWLRELILDGTIMPGVVDNRNIEDVRSSEIRGFTRYHFFAGCGVWDFALQLAGFPANESVCTASPPCQSYSNAGKRKGHDDERNLWPQFFRILRESAFDTLFVEQVASSIPHRWLDGVCTDLESEDYAAGPIVLGAHSVGSPHKRQRLLISAYKLAHTSGQRVRAEGRSGDDRSQEPLRGKTWERQRIRDDTGNAFSGMGEGDADNDGPGINRWAGAVMSAQSSERQVQAGFGALADAKRDGRWLDKPISGAQGRIADRGIGAWGDFDIVKCPDGKIRRIKCGLQPLVDGSAEKLVRSGNPGAPVDADYSSEGRKMRLHGYGNAINPYVAAEVIAAFLEDRKSRAASEQRVVDR